jgi:hypothetical protein
MVLDACPDFGDYAKGVVANWRDFMATACLVRSVLGISPTAWDDAQKVMGEIPAAILIACILQRASTIKSAGGYLRVQRAGSLIPCGATRHLPAEHNDLPGALRYSPIPSTPCD